MWNTSAEKSGEKNVERVEASFCMVLSAGLWDLGLEPSNERF